MNLRNEIHRRKIREGIYRIVGARRILHHLGITITRNPDEVLIEDDLQTFLLTQYAGQGITVNEIYYSSTQIPFCFRPL